MRGCKPKMKYLQFKVYFDDEGNTITEYGKQGHKEHAVHKFVIEILASETLEMFEEKTKDYPCHATPLRAEDVVERNLRMFLPNWKIERPILISFKFVIVLITN